MADSTAARTRRKAAAKPHKDFPLFPHAAGYWAKKIRGKLRYFGKIASDPKGDAALALWLEQKDALLAGRTPRPKHEGLTLEDLCDTFMTAKDNLLAAGELSKRTYDEYKETCKRLGDQFGFARFVDDLTPADFEKLRASIAKQWGPVRLGNEIQRVRSIFKFGFESGLIERPLRFGPGFKRPSAKTLRIERAKKGLRMFEAADLQTIIKAAGVQLRAMVYLAANCGYGNGDIGHLPLSALDLQGGWICFPRPKTGVPRRCPLWPETVAAVKAAIAERPQPKDEAHRGLVFITKYGKSWHKETPDNPISKEFRKLLNELKLHRPGLGFYSMRHGFETIGGEAKDQVAVNAIMGHVPHSGDMASIYRERISDERLVAVVNHVRGWLLEGGVK